MNIEVGSYEAKTKLPELLRGIQAGNRYTITLRGEPVAELIPAGSTRDGDAVAAVAQMQQIMLAGRTTKRIDLKALIAEGRA